MPQSLVKNYVHLIFSTKDRQDLIDKAIQDELYAYVGGICKEMECYPYAIGGVENHIHILCLLSKKVALVDLLKTVKAQSSRWIKTKGKKYQKFYWQKGYGAFSINPSEISLVKDYIYRQEEHHQKKTFKQELLYFLNKYDVPYNEKYMWD